MIDDKLIQSPIDYNARQAVSNGFKSESGGPKGTIVANMERGDCLSVGAYPTYGNGVFVVGFNPKGDRKCHFKQNSQHNGIRYYSKAVAPLHKSETDKNTTKGDLPRKFEKLTQICATPKNGFKVNDIYKLMFNTIMYEVAYHKLKSNPGNMTPGITPVTLDGISLG